MTLRCLCALSLFYSFSVFGQKNYFEFLELLNSKENDRIEETRLVSLNQNELEIKLTEIKIYENQRVKYVIKRPYSYNQFTIILFEYSEKNVVTEMNSYRCIINKDSSFIFELGSSKRFTIDSSQSVVNIEEIRNEVKFSMFCYLPEELSKNPPCRGYRDNELQFIYRLSKHDSNRTEIFNSQVINVFSNDSFDVSIVYSKDRFNLIKKVYNDDLTHKRSYNLATYDSLGNISSFVEDNSSGIHTVGYIYYEDLDSIKRYAPLFNKLYLKTWFAGGNNVKYAINPTLNNLVSFFLFRDRHP